MFSKEVAQNPKGRAGLNTASTQLGIIKMQLNVIIAVGVQYLTAAGR